MKRIMLSCICAMTTFCTIIEQTISGSIRERSSNDVEKFIILPSNNSDDIIALVDKTSQEIFVIYRKK